VAEPLDPQPALPQQGPSAPPVSSRALTLDAMERLLSQIAQGTDPTEGRTGSEYLLFTCGHTPCAVPLTELREVLPSLPAAVPLPFSPPWLLGVFPLRTELVGLADPTPVLLGALRGPEPGAPRPTTAIIVGDANNLLGLAVSSVGDIAVVEPDEIVHDHSLDGPQVALPYAAGHYLTPDGSRIYAVVHMPRLVADVLAALTEAAANG
jgi:chemotaxis signal transduction protein